MATKTFKIGLSNTDKQNMAQDVYERLIAMCFDEYDSTKTYNKGDFVVYENPSDTFKLYKCNSDNVTGAWDGSKWDLATFQDLVDDIESAVAFVNDKANVDGNYPTMTVGVADQLSPYDDESGDDQDEPFSFQATGTGNGSQPDFSTGAIALMKEKQGNTVVVNQYVGDSSWSSTANDVSFSREENTHKYTISGTATGNVGKGLLGVADVVPAGHKVLLLFENYSKTGTNTATIYYEIATYTHSFSLTSDNPTRIVETPNPLNLVFACNEGQNVGYEFVLYVIDLTQWFNGDIPQDLLDNPENFFRYYQGSLAYNTGELVNANGRYIKCIGMNQWDEEYLSGYTLGSSGDLVDGVTAICSKNYINVIPNRDYYYKVGTGGYLVICFYDKDKNFIERLYGYSRNNHYKTPSNAIYARFSVVSGYGTTYNHDISINLYYEDEARCLTYEPYEVLTNNDTGTETLRSAGSVKDYKTPDGTIHRLVGSVDLGSLEWEYDSGNTRFKTTTALTNAKSVADIYSKNNLLCPLYSPMTAIDSSSGEVNMGALISAYLFITNFNYNNAATFKTAMSGVYLFYELAEPTTEQGTPFSENLVIDDFGTMDFQGTNGVPQGNLIFYPVDYKAFIDTLYDYTEGTPSNIALKSDLPTAPQTWAESLPGYDATKTQTLKNVEGTLTWVDEE